MLSFVTLVSNDSKWESYMGSNYNGRYYGMKAESFDTYVDIPQKTKSVIEVVVSDSTAPKQRLVEYSWLLSYPKEFPVIPENTRNIFNSQKLNSVLPCRDMLKIEQADSAKEVQATWQVAGRLCWRIKVYQIG